MDKSEAKNAIMGKCYKGKKMLGVPMTVTRVTVTQ